MEGKLKFGFLALIIIIVQSILKIIGVIITGSLSFLSETIDTVIDIFFVGLTLYSLSISQKPADFEHMYGHAKIDSVGAMTQGIILINIYGFLIFNAIQAILNQTFSVEQPIFGLQLLIISILINFIFSLILLWQGRKRSSLSLRVQGLNLLQDSLRAILVIINFVFVIFWQIFYLDPIFSLILAIIIIFTSLKLIKDGINNLLDVNPVRPKLIEEIKAIIKNLQNVNEINQFRIRASGNKLFIEVNLRVEDHISIVHADEITKAIRRLVQFYFPKYDTESIIEMNPLTSEKSLKEKIINLIYSLIMDYPMILDIKNLNIFSIEKDYF
ncbi:MAG: cation diffusion facilitator family transporter, partial [Promethearchaeati archaeon]